MAPDLSVVVVSYNTRDHLARCLASLLVGARIISYEVIVVDNASSDGSADMVRSEHPDATLIANGENVGFAAACNQALAIARGRHALLLNSDAETLDGALDSMVSYIDSRPDVGALGPRLENPDGSLQPSGTRMPSALAMIRSALPAPPGPGGRGSRFRERGRDYERVQEVEVVSGACLLFRREAGRDIGHLDERYFFYYEDLDFCSRLRAAGWKVAYFPRARVLHHWGGSSREVPTSLLLRIIEGRQHFLRTHHGRLTEILVRLLTAAVALGKLLVLSLRFLVGSDVREALRRQLSIVALSASGRVTTPRGGRERRSPGRKEAGPAGPGEETVLIVTQEFRAMRGGVADHCFHLARTLVAGGMRTAILTSADSRVVRDGGLEVHPEVRSWGASRTLDVFRRIRGLRPGVMNLHYVPYAFDDHGVPLQIALLGVAVRASGIRLVTTVHEVGTRFEWGRPKYWGVASLQRLILLVLALCSARILIVCESHRRALRRFRSKLDFIPPGSNFLPLEVSEEERARLRSGMGAKGDLIITTFAGGGWYRPDLVIRAAKRLIDPGGRRVRVLVLGGRLGARERGGQSIPDLVAELGMEDAVHIPGYLEEEDVFRHLEASDIFVLIDLGVYGGVSSKSTSLTAAFAAGLACVGNRGRLTGSLFVDGENLLLLDSAGIAEIARAIERLIDDPDLRSRLGEGARGTYRARFDWERNAEEYRRALTGRVPGDVPARARGG